jgi:hypothetical protein
MNIVATGGMKNKMIKLLDLITEKSPCWKGYKQIGMKDKNGREVPNCVPFCGMIKLLDLITEKSPCWKAISK